MPRETVTLFNFPEPDDDGSGDKQADNSGTKSVAHAEVKTGAANTDGWMFNVVNSTRFHNEVPHNARESDPVVDGNYDAPLPKTLQGLLHEQALLQVRAARLQTQMLLDRALEEKESQEVLIKAIEEVQASSSQRDLKASKRTSRSAADVMFNEIIKRLKKLWASLPG